VGATPGSTDLAFFLQRLTKEVKPDMKDIASDLETLIQLTNSLLSNPNTEPVILFIDAVNQVFTSFKLKKIYMDVTLTKFNSLYTVD